MAETGGFFVAQAAVGVEPEPARGGAVPGDHVHVGVAEQARSINLRCGVELGQGRLAQRDFLDREALKVGTDRWHEVPQDGAGVGLQHGVRRGGQHSEKGALHGRGDPVQGRVVVVWGVPRRWIGGGRSRLWRATLNLERNSELGG